jgi:hypothetical protein
MALVPDSWIDEWKKKDSFIYQNYEYIYSNPVWEKDVPKGASLCPYFWKSVIAGFLFLRCFLVPLILIGRCLLSKLGKGANKLDSSLINYFGGDTGKLGGLGIVCIVAFPAVLAILYFFIEFTLCMYIVNLETNYEYFCFTWGFYGFIFSLILHLYYNIKQPSCDIRKYSYIWALVVVLVIIYECASDVLIWCKETVIGIWEWFCMFLADVYAFLFASESSSGFWSFVLLTFASMFVLFFVGNFLSKRNKKDDDAVVNRISDSYVCYNAFELKISRHYKKYLKEDEEYELYKENKIFDKFYRSTFEKTVNEYFDLDNIKMKDYDGHKRNRPVSFYALLDYIDGDEDSVNEFKEKVFCIDSHSSYMHGKSKRIVDLFKKTYSENFNIYNDVDKYITDLDEVIRIKNIKKARCEKFSKIMDKILYPAKFILTLIKYMIVVAKSKKQGVCPYFMFEDGESKETDKGE